jgi:hypothetical protein
MSPLCTQAPTNTGGAIESAWNLLPSPESSHHRRSWKSEISKLDLEPIQPSDEGFDYRQIGTRQLSVRRRCQFYRSRPLFNSTTRTNGCPKLPPNAFRGDARVADISSAALCSAPTVGAYCFPTASSTPVTYDACSGRADRIGSFHSQPVLVGSSSTVLQFLCVYDCSSPCYSCPFSWSVPGP